MTNSTMICGSLANFKTDPAELALAYHKFVEPVPSTRYYDNEAEYSGWAITSRDGSVDDGVKRIALNGGTAKGRTATPLNIGPIRDVLSDLEERKVDFYRVRVMRLVSGTFEMKFHRDATKESWRLHVPIITDPESFFEWNIDGRIVRKHLPADGRAWLVRVDLMHRAVALGSPGRERVHLLMSLGRSLMPDMLADVVHTR